MEIFSSIAVWLEETLLPYGGIGLMLLVGLGTRRRVLFSALRLIGVFVGLGVRASASSRASNRTLKNGGLGVSWLLAAETGGFELGSGADWAPILASPVPYPAPWEAILRTQAG